MKKRQSIIFGIAAVCLLSTEIFLRQYYGFCDTVLMIEDADYEYMAQPSQDRFRFRNRIKYNSESMRSPEVDTTAGIILGFGDSVINGGVLTDHDSLATTILSDTLSKIQGKKVQFLNISAGSWGPDNCFAYLKKHGDFGAESIFLFVSSQDAFDTMDFKKIVDVDPSFPSRQYSLAFYELLDRYAMPRIERLLKKQSTNTKYIELIKKEDRGILNTGFESFLTYARSKDIPLTIYLHADREELKAGNYNQQGQAIIKFANEKDIRIIMDLDNNLELNDFRDEIHINSRGQKKLATTLIDNWNDEISVQK